MQLLFEILGIKDLNSVLRHRLILCLFCLLTFIVLLYFWNLSKKKSGVNKISSQGLIFLSLTFFLYFSIGFVSAYNPSNIFYLAISGLINVCVLLSLPFFSQGNHLIDKLVHHRFWKYFVIILGIIWLVFIFSTGILKPMYNVDIVLTSVSIFLLGLFLTMTFVRKELNFLGIITGLFIAFTIWLQINSPEVLGEGKFVHINTTILSPALFLSIITISYAFNWMNELNFRELSNIYTENDIHENENEIKGLDISKNTLSIKWQEQIVNDDLEKVIEELINFKKNKNENLGILLNIASRNNRNNTNRLKDLIKYEDYQLNRNKISEALVLMMT